MKFKQKLVDNIITVDEEFAFLESMSDGAFRYLVRFFVNPQLALVHNNSTVNVYISKNPNFETNIPIFNTTTPAFAEPSKTPLSVEKITNDLLKRSAIVKDVIRSATIENSVLDIKTDFTARISNELSQQFAKKDISQPIVVKTVRSFTSAPVQSLQKQNLSFPIMEHSVSPVASLLQSDDANIKKLSNEILQERNLDPSSLFVKQNAIIASKNNFGGVIQKTNIPNIPSYFKPILGSLNTGNVEKPKVSQLTPNAVISIPSIADVTNVLMEEYIDIPFGSINSDEFYIVFVLKDKDNIPVQKLIKNVKHGKNVAIMRLPKIAPSISVLPVSKLGKNVLEIRQNDPNGVGINLYRKTVFASKVATDAEYTFIGKINLTSSDGPKIVEDFVSNGNQIIYRAITFGEDEQLGFEYSSAVAKPFTTGRGMKLDSKKKTFVGMSYDITNTGINISLLNMPTGPSSVILMKRDLTANKASVYVDKPRLISKNGSEQIIFKDSNVSKGRIYEYSYRLIYKDGSEAAGSNVLTIEYVPETNNIVTTQIINPRIVEKGTDYDAEFTLESSFINSGEDELRKVLSQQGLSDFFNSDLKIENLQNLIAYGIVRNNLTTGEIEDFGIVADKDFSDIKFGRVKGVKPIKNGNEYEYSVTTLFRSPITLLENYVKEVVDEKNPDNSYSFQPFFWLHPVSLKEGNIITKRSLVRYHAKTQFSFGEVGNIIKTTLSLSDTLPSIYEGNATKINSKLIKIQWKLQGTANKVQYYIVVLDMLGMKTVVGKTHSITNTNYFEFYDELTNNEKGSLSYTIIPVYYDQSRGKKITTNKVLV